MTGMIREHLYMWMHLRHFPRGGLECFSFLKGKKGKKEKGYGN